MNVLIYTAGDTELGRRLKDTVLSVDSISSLKDCWNFSELNRCFRTPEPLPETVILLAENRKELEAFKAFRPRLDQVFFILVLPDSEDGTIACGHSLRPRYLAYRDGDFQDVQAVLNRMVSKLVDEDNAAGMKNETHSTSEC